MDPSSAEAYDLPRRVDTYDAGMDIMHPLRLKMIPVALEVLPFYPTQALKALDLGVGTGLFPKGFFEIQNFGAKLFGKPRQIFHNSNRRE